MTSFFCGVVQHSSIVTDVSRPLGSVLGMSVGPIGCSETSVATNVRCVTFQKNESLKIKSVRTLQYL
jgi:hypothetical protein